MIGGLFVLVAAVCVVHALPTASPVTTCLQELRDIVVTKTSDPATWNATHRVSNVDWDGKAHVEPAFVALPRSNEDVMRCLRCARTHGLRVAVKGGGHSFGGYSDIPAEEGFMINMAHMAVVSPVISTSPTEAYVVAEAGARWRDVYQSFKASGENWIVTGGLCPSVGVAGFVMGGGTGPSARLHGLGVDSVLNFTMVKADGSEVVYANEKENPDLFWALRGGGGGNFGVVTQLSLKVFPGPHGYSYTWGTLCFDWADNRALLTALEIFGEKLPRTVNVDVITSPEDGACMWIISMQPLNTTRDALAPILEFVAQTSKNSSSSISKKGVVRGAPISDTLQETNCWWEMISAFAVAHGYSEYGVQPYYSRNCFVDGISDDFISAVISLSESHPPEYCDDGHHFISFGGKAAEVDPTATAFAWRSTKYMVYTSCGYDEGSSASKLEASTYLDKWEQTLAPFCNGGSYVNFIDPLARKGADRRYYGVNVDRLREIKKKWNPVDNNGPFHFPMEILENDEQEQ